MNAMPHALEPNAAEIGRFVHALFRYADDGGYVSLRAFDQFDRRDKPPVLIRPVRINGAGLEPIIPEAVSAARMSDNTSAPTAYAGTLILRNGEVVHLTRQRAEVRDD